MESFPLILLTFSVAAAAAAVLVLYRMRKGTQAPAPVDPPEAVTAGASVTGDEEESVLDPETVSDADTVSDAITVNSTDAQEKELTLAEKEELRQKIDEGIELVEAVIFEPFDVDDSDAMVKAIASCVDGLRRGATYPDRWPSLEVAGPLLGLLWGEHLVTTGGWRWVGLASGPHHGHAVVSPDRAHAVFPTEVVHKLLVDPARISPLVTVYEMVRDRRVLAASPGSRTPLA